MTNISEWAISRPAVVAVVFVILSVLGAISFYSLPISRFPDIDTPLISVSINQTGATPDDLETQIASKVEPALADVAGLKSLRTALGDGRATFTAEFRARIDSSRALEAVQDAVARIRGDLPKTISEPVIERLDVRERPLATYAATSSTLTPDQLSAFVDERTIKDIEAIDGVARVMRLGGVTREIRVRLRPEELAARGLSASSVSQTVHTASYSRGSGRMALSDQDQPIRTLALIQTVEDIRTTNIPVGGDRYVQLGDIALVADGMEDPVSFARLNAEPIVTLSVFAEKAADEVETARGVEELISTLSRAEPSIDYKLIDETVSYTQGNVESTLQVLLEGAFCTIVVVFLFLRDWRATLIAALSLPLALIPTFWFMSLMGFSLNLVSLLGLALAIGLLVDDSIVEIENIARHLQMGKTPLRAAIDATQEIGTSVIAISLTIVAVFVPVTMVGGLPGQYFREFGLTVAAATLLSLLVARLVTPLLAAHLMRSAPAPKPVKTSRPEGLYASSLSLSVRRLPYIDMSYVTVGVGIVVVMTTVIAGVQRLPRGFVPKEDGRRVQIAIEMPAGSAYASMLRKADNISRALETIPEVEQIYTYRPPSADKGAVADRFMVQLTLSHASVRVRTQADIEADATAKLANIPDIRSRNMGQTGTSQFSFALESRDPDSLSIATERLRTSMRQMSHFRNISTSEAVLRPETQIVPDADRLAQLGIDAEQISQTVRVAMSGDTTRDLATLNEGTRQTPIRVQLNTIGRDNLQTIRTLPLVSHSGQIVPVGAVAAVTVGYGAAKIERRDGFRRIEVSADLENGSTVGQALKAVTEWIDENPLPGGVTVEPTGDAETMQDFFKSFALATGLGLLAVFCVLVLLLGNPLQPLTILLSLPLSLGGAFAALLITGHALSMPVLIGALMLMGIVAKNAILIVDLASRIAKTGAESRIAVVTAARQRARPILMTTAAMAAGMMPAALGFGDGGEFRAPMAVAVIGGLVVSTALSLVFVPALFLIMDSSQRACQTAFRHDNAARFAGRLQAAEVPRGEQIGRQ
ncbi:efflux RND transporter permease subunit [Rhizobium herbae]